MIYWNYLCLNNEGTVIEGVLCGTKKEVYEILWGKKLTVQRVGVDIKLSIKELLIQKKLSNKETIGYFRNFKKLYENGNSPHVIFKLLKEFSHTKKLKMVIDQIEKQVQQGKTITESMKKTEVFDWVSINAFAAGEKAGSLGLVSDELVNHYIQKENIKWQVARAIVFPFSTIFLIVGLFFFITLYAVPQLNNILPKESLTTSYILGMMFISRLIQKIWGLIILIPIIFIFILVKIRNSAKEKEAKFFYRIPLVGNISKYLTLSIYFQNLAILLRAGILIVPAIEELIKYSPRNYVRKMFEKMSELIRKGQTVTQSIQAIDFFPKITALNVGIDEEVGKIHDAFFLTALNLKEKGVNTIDFVLKVINPIILLVSCGLIVCVGLGFLYTVWEAMLNSTGI